MNGNKDALIYYQDKHALNVNLVLLIFFLLSRGENVSSKQVFKLQECLKASEQNTIELREKRRALGKINKHDQKYKDALTKEIDSEKLQQEALLACLESEGDLKEKQPQGTVQKEQVRVLLRALVGSGMSSQKNKEFEKKIDILLSNFTQYQQTELSKT